MTYEEELKLKREEAAKYNDSCLRPQVEPEWMQMANEMANAIISRFDPSIQNETLNAIRVAIKANREMEINETEKKLSYLKDTIQAL